jgi:hypothetical protein
MGAVQPAGVGGGILSLFGFLFGKYGGSSNRNQLAEVRLLKLAFEMRHEVDNNSLWKALSHFTYYRVKPQWWGGSEHFIVNDATQPPKAFIVDGFPSKIVMELIKLEEFESHNALELYFCKRGIKLAKRQFTISDLDCHQPVIAC